MKETSKAEDRNKVEQDKKKRKKRQIIRIKKLSGGENQKTKND